MSAEIKRDFAPEIVSAKRPLLIVNELSGATSGSGRVYGEVERCLANQSVPFVELNARTSPTFKTKRIPTYPEIEIVTNPLQGTFSFIEETQPGAIHVGTVESPLGLATLLYCNLMNIPYTASYRIKVPEYAAVHAQEMLRNAIQLPPERFNGLVRMLYKNAQTVFVPNTMIGNELEQIGITNTKSWPRGVNLEEFRPPSTEEENIYKNYAWFSPDKKTLLHVGRVSPEKNITALLQGNFDSKTSQLVIIGPGSDEYKQALQQQYGREGVMFLNSMDKVALSAHYRWADAVMFPSLTDTHGNVMTESLASGTPVIAYNGTVASELVQHQTNGLLVDQGDDLFSVVEQLDHVDRNNCRKSVDSRTWDKTATILLNNLTPIPNRWGSGPYRYAASRIIRRFSA